MWSFFIFSHTLTLTHTLSHINTHTYTHTHAVRAQRSHVTETCAAACLGDVVLGQTNNPLPELVNP